MRDQLARPTRAPRFLTRLATTLAAGFVAFLIALALLTPSGHKLESLPHALNALVFTGVLVPIMGNLVMPVLRIARWAGGPPATPGPHGGSAPGSAASNADEADPASQAMNDPALAQVSRDVSERGTQNAREHPQLPVLPDWPVQTIAVLSTVDRTPHGIPVSAPLRAQERRIVFSLQCDRASLARLRKRPHVALTILATGDVALTARGRARVIQPLACAPDYVAVAIDVEHIDDHRQPEFRVESGIDRRWVNETQQHALRQRVQELSELGPRA